MGLKRVRHDWELSSHTCWNINCWAGSHFTCLCLLRTEQAWSIMFFNQEMHNYLLLGFCLGLRFSRVKILIHHSSCNQVVVVFNQLCCDPMFNHAFLSLSVIERKLLYLGASLVAQPVKNPPAMQETPVQFLGWEDPLEEGMATHSSILTWTIPMDRGAWWTTVHGVTKNLAWLSN